MQGGRRLVEQLQAVTRSGDVERNRRVGADAGSAVHHGEVHDVAALIQPVEALAQAEEMFIGRGA